MNGIYSALSNSTDRVYLEVHVQPGASKTEISGLHGDSLKIRLKSPPVDGKANAALIDFLAQITSLPKRNILLVRGDTSRRKRIAFVSSTLEQIAAAIQKHL